VGPFGTQVAANTLGTLIAAGMIYLVGVAAGLFAAHWVPITLAACLPAGFAFGLWITRDIEAIEIRVKPQRVAAVQQAVDDRTGDEDPD
jgi:hypothetical protein